METAKRTVIFLTVVFLTAATAQSAEKSAEEISNTRRASCLVKVTADPAIFPLDYDTMYALLRSSHVGGKAAREILGISPDKVLELIEVEIAAFVGADTILPKPVERTKQSSEFEPEQMMEMTEEKMEMTGIEGPPTLPGSSSAAPKLQPLRTTTGRRPRPMQTPRPTAPATSPSFAAEKAIILHVVVQLEENTKPAAEEFMNVLIENLRRALLAAFNSDMERLDSQRRLAAEETDRPEKDLVGMQQHLREISGSRDLSRLSVLSEINRLRRQIDSAKLDKARNSATIEATTKQIAEIEAKTKEQLKNDPVTNELQRMYELQIRRFENTEKLVDGGRASSAELADAEEKLARARIELAKRREEINKSEGGDRLNRLNSDLASYSLSTAQTEVLLSGLERQLAEAEELLAKADEYELLSLKADVAKQNLHEVLLWRERIGQHLRLIQPPTVTVLGAD